MIGRACLLLITVWLAVARGSHVAFANNGLMDDVTVSVNIGTPPRPYVLRVVFSRDAYVAPYGHIALYHHKHHMHSSTYATRIHMHLGTDLVDFSGRRWHARIAYAEPDKRSVGEDGLWYLSVRSATMPVGAWTRFAVTRRGLYAGVQAEHPLPAAHGACVAPLALHGGDRRVLGVVEGVRVSIGDDDAPSETRYRLEVAPDEHTTRLPYELFQAYFERRNVYADNPEDDWPDVHLHLADGCCLRVAGGTLLPRSTLRPGGTLNSREPVLQTLMHEEIRADSEGDVSRGHAMRGYDALKVHPARRVNDTRTIVLAGSVLWGCAEVHVDQARGAAYLVADAPRRHINLLDAFWLVTLSISYIRWKFAGSWFDCCARHDHFMIVLTRASLLTSVGLLGSHVSTYVVYYRFIAPFRTTLDAVVFYGGVLADAAILVLVGLHLRAVFARACRDLLIGVRALGRWLESGGGGATGTAPDGKARTEPVVPERLPCQRGQWDPRAAYAGRRSNRDFVWLPLTTFVLYSILLDIVFAATVWFTVTPLEDRLFADIILLLAYSAATYEITYYALLAATSVFKWTPPTVWRGESRTLLVALFLALAVAFDAFSFEAVFHRIIDDYSTIYEGSVLVIVTAFYMLVLIFVASRLARNNLDKSLVHVR